MTAIKFTPFTPNREAAACRCGCGFDVMDYELVEILKDIALHFITRSININSWCRCEWHNEKVGGAPRSQHRLGKAADIVVPGVSPEEVFDYLNTKYKDKYGIGKYRTFTHVDSRASVARWVKG